MKLKPRTEREVAKDIVDYMQMRGYVAIRCIAGPVRNMRGGEWYAPQIGNPAGFPDWCFVHFMRYPKFYEIKAPGKKPTQIQEAWLARLRRDGFDADWYDGFRDEGKKPFLRGDNA